MAMNIKDQNGNEEKVEIRLNRKMRTWNKYRNYIIVGGAIVVVILLMVLILRGCSNDSDTKTGEATTAVQATTAASKNDGGQTTTDVAEATKAQQTTTAAVKAGATLQIAGAAQEQDYTSRDQFAGVTFIGDSIISGFSYYGYVGDDSVISDGNMTSDKISEHVEEIAAKNPSKVVLMVGLNDLNYGTRGASTIADYILSFVDQVKGRVSSAKIYVLSVLPVTSGFEAGSNVNITQSGIDELNGILSSKAGEKGYNYVDVSTAFKDGSGYMSDSYTGNGSNIYNEYYPFLLNGLAGVLK